MEPFEISSSGDGIALRLVGEVTIEHARALHAALCVHLRLARLNIDAAALTRLDTAALQVLLAASSAAAGVTVTARSDAWDEAFRRYAIQLPASSTPRTPAARLP